MAGLSFDSRSSNSAFLSAGIFSADAIADLVFSMCSSVIYECHGLAAVYAVSSLDRRVRRSRLQREFRRVMERIQDKTKPFAETDKDRHHNRAHMLAHENI